MILSDTEILAAVARGDIVIDPFDPACLGGNSYDVHLAPELKTYRTHYLGRDHPLDAAKDNQTQSHHITEKGFILRPGVLYLAATYEYTETHNYVPYLDGKSSVGRLGISIHATAGRGDVGFANHWTMEIFVTHPVKVYPGMPIGQLTYHQVLGQVDRQYSTKPGTSYGALPRDPSPQPSRLWTKLGRRTGS